MRFFSTAAIAALALAALAPSAAADAETAAAEAAALSLEARPWPTHGWEPGDIAPDGLAKLAGAAFDNAEMGETRAVLVIHQGRLVHESYGEDFGADMPMISWSMAKSFTHALVGRAVQDGLIETIDAPMPSPWSNGDKRAAITWRQWMQMVDGLGYRELDAGITESDVVKMMFGQGRWNVVDYMSDLKLAREPGAHWNYSSGATHLVAKALQTTVVGSAYDAACSTAAANRMAKQPSATPCSPIDAPFAEWADEALFGPLGMAAQLEFDPAGTWLGGSLVWMTGQDFAKLGYLYLNDGEWDGEQLLPDDWVAFASTPGPAANSDIYGAGWWLTPPEGRGKPVHGASDRGPRDLYSAQGLGGQMIAVAPSQDLVIVRLGAGTDTMPEWDALYDWIADVAILFEARGDS